MHTRDTLQPKDSASSYRWHDRGGPNRYRHDRPKDQLRVVSLKPQGHCTGRSRKLKLYDFTSHFPIPEPAHPRLSLAAVVDWFHRHWTREPTVRDGHAIASPVPRRPFRTGVPAASVATAQSRYNSQLLQLIVVALRHHLSIYQRTGRRPRIAAAGPPRREAQTRPRSDAPGDGFAPDCLHSQL